MITKGTILITGAAKRIGRALALRLSRAGYDIALHCHGSLKEANVLAGAIRKAGRKAHVFSCDLADQDALRHLIPDVKRSCPQLNGLINNASLFKPSKISAPSLKAFQEHFNVNLTAPYILIKQFASYCARGSIINILDTHINASKTMHADYLLSKKALAALGELSAAELAPNIRVNAIAPGLILAPEGKSQGYLNRRAKSIPLKRKGSPEDIAQAALFLLENEFITGQTIFVDGGEHLH
jgi:pteridine reductase